MSPRTCAAVRLLAIAAPFLTIGAFGFDLFLGFERKAFPHWSDWISIPLMAAPLLLVTLLVWSGAHLAFLRSPYCPALLAQAASFKTNWWLLTPAAITAILVLLCIAVGQYWYAIPGTIWLYFYVSLAAVRRVNRDAEGAIAKATPDAR